MNKARAAQRLLPLRGARHAAPRRDRQGAYGTFVIISIISSSKNNPDLFKHSLPKG